VSDNVSTRCNAFSSSVPSNGAETVRMGTSRAEEVQGRVVNFVNKPSIRTEAAASSRLPAVKRVIEC